MTDEDEDPDPGWVGLTGGERSRAAVNTQTLRLRLAPLLFDDQGNMLAEAEQFVSDRDGRSRAGLGDAVEHERE